MPEQQFTSEDYETAIRLYRRDFHVPEGETDILLGALRMASRVMGDELHAAVQKGMHDGLWLEDFTLTIRKALLIEES